MSQIDKRKMCFPRPQIYLPQNWFVLGIFVCWRWVGGREKRY